MRVRVGVQVQPQHGEFDRMRRAWREAEEIGADCIYTWDHFYPLRGEPEGRHFEGLACLASLAENTQRAEVGALVFCNSYRNPNLLADAHRTIDHISGGRVVLGIGAGWFAKDYEEYGYEFGTAPDRLRALRRDLPIMRERLRRLNPPPLRDMPILIGGGGEKVTLRLVAEHADTWHAFADLDTYVHKAQVLARHCERVGRDPAEIEHSVSRFDRDLPRHADAYLEAGVRQFVVNTGGPDFDLSTLLEMVAWRDRLGV
ncbi:MAG TPA: LLM class F420-dependent oxidoreductase [Capillimicrobium sp.]|nr:LLM class F420-dependent oxidoreductase [Capillimicrobium sp.]